jgi:hypothetical protein
MNQSTLTENKSINNESSISYASQPITSPSHINAPKQETNQADSIEKILSSSIQRAKQKITMLESRQREERS